MIRILLASHCDLAESFLCTGKMICGNELMKDVIAVTIKEGASGISDLEQQCKKVCDEYSEDSFLILTDILGASPFNTCLSIFRDADYRVVTGMNLTMLIDVAIKKDQLSLDELATAAAETGKQGIEKVVLNKVSQECDDEEDF